MKKRFRALIERLFPGRFQRNTSLQELYSIRMLLNSFLVQHKLEWELNSPELAARFWDEKRLLRYGFKVNSQNAEDGMIHEVFRRIGHKSKVFVEVGVGNGLENNTAFLLSTGWTGSWIDGDCNFRAVLNSRPDIDDKTLRTHVGVVTKDNIEDMLGGLGVSSDFDFLSLDIDQNTYHVWSALRHYRPRLVVVEYNATLPPDVDWCVHYDAHRTWDGSHNFGASLKAYENLGRDLGYCLVGCDLAGCNAFFVRSDLVGDHFCAPFTSENHYQPFRYPSVLNIGSKPAILDRAPSKLGGDLA